MGSYKNGSLIPKPPLGNQIHISNSQTTVGSSKINLIPSFILPSKHGFHSDSEFLLLNPASKWSLKVEENGAIDKF